MKREIAYKNPIPSVNDKRTCKEYSIVFTFEDYVTKEEAVAGINTLLEQEGGKIPVSWIEMGKARSIRYALPQD